MSENDDLLTLFKCCVLLHLTITLKVTGQRQAYRCNFLHFPSLERLLFKFSSFLPGVISFGLLKRKNNAVSENVRKYST